jgi:MtfA peptidase
MNDLLPVVLLGLACFAGGYFVIVQLLRRGSWGRQIRFRPEPIPSAWPDIVDRRVPLARGLSGDERERLLRLAQVFLAEKHFEGCGGVTVTEEMRVTIAAVACLLLLHMEGPCYPALRTVLIYPHAFVPKLAAVPGTGEVVEPSGPLGGQSWRDGVVVVAWDEVVSGARDATDGHNVVLHEFAHQLDQEDGVADGAPLLPAGALRTWARVLGREYERLRNDATAQRLSALDPYGATDKAEFFAVATESFFERPLQLEGEHPELYGELKRFYGQDPARRARPDST